MKLDRYKSELKKRNVIKPALAYLLVAWIIIQVASIVLPTFNAPPYVMKVILFVLSIGFLVWVIFSWVYEVTPEGIKKSSGTEQKKSIPLSSVNRLNYLIISLLSIAIILLIFNTFINSSRKKNENAEVSSLKDTNLYSEKSIAVLPLFNVNKDDNLEYFSDGVTQEIIDELAKVKQFKISAFSSTVIYKGTKKTLQEIASELNVSLILSGSSRIFSDSVRLSIELVDPKSKNRIWNKRYDEELSNALRIQSDIAKQVVNELNIELSPEEIKDLDKKNTYSPEAFDFLLQAKAAYVDLSKEGSLKSIKMLEHAIELDPDYAQAYTLLAWIHILNGFAEVIPDAGLAVNTVAKARPLIDKSISLDPSISDNYLIMGALDLFYLNNLPSAFENVEKALKMSSWPKVPTNYCICTAISVFAALGELSEATDLVKLSKKTDLSNYFVFSDEGLVLLLKGETEKAIYAFKQAAEFNEIPYFNYNIGWTYYHIGEFEEALLYLDKAFVGEKEPLGNVLAFLSNTHYKMGNIEMSEYYRNLMLKRRSIGKANLMIPLAMVSAGRGNTEDALHFLEQAYKEKEYGFAWFLNIDPVFDELKSNAAFIELVNRIGFEQN